MQEQDGSGSKFDISARLEALRQEHAALAWEGSFRDYFEVESRAFCARRNVENSFINRKASRPLKS